MWLGQDEGVLRLPSALISIATLPLMFLLGRFVAGDRHGFKVGLVAMLAFAVSPGQIDYAQDARPYAFWIFALALALVGLAWLVRNPKAACLAPSRWMRMPAPAGAFGALSIGLVRRVQWVFDPDDLLLGSLSERFCLRRYFAGIDVFQVTRRRETASASCIEDTLVDNPVCPGALTRLARSGLGCLGPDADVSHCPKHKVRCRLDFE